MIYFMAFYLRLLQEPDSGSHLYHDTSLFFFSRDASRAFVYLCMAGWTFTEWSRPHYIDWLRSRTRRQAIHRLFFFFFFSLPYQFFSYLYCQYVERQPAMQSTLGTARASCFPQGVLNGALGEQTSDPVWALVRLSTFLTWGDVCTCRRLTRIEGTSFWVLDWAWLRPVGLVQENISNIAYST